MYRQPKSFFFPFAKLSHYILGRTIFRVKTSAISNEVANSWLNATFWMRCTFGAGFRWRCHLYKDDVERTRSRKRKKILSFIPVDMLTPNTTRPSRVFERFRPICLVHQYGHSIILLFADIIPYSSNDCFAALLALSAPSLKTTRIIHYISNPVVEVHLRNAREMAAALSRGE